MRNIMVRGAAGQPLRTKQWYKTTIERKVKRVCATCNNGWMSNMEGATLPLLMPMIRGVAVVLNPTAQRTVAAWAAKTAFMLRYTETPPHHVHHEHLHWLFTKQEAPPDAQVLLATYSGKMPVQYDLKTLTVSTRGPVALHRDVEVVTVSIGRFVFQVWVWTDPLDRTTGLRMPADDAPRDFVVPIWPPTSFDRTWPPTAALNATDFFRFSRTPLPSPIATSRGSTPNLVLTPRGISLRGRSARQRQR
ncbi:MAG: hypothetical protein ACRDJN_07915 [Chloroflexota bacterium]